MASTYPTTIDAFTNPTTSSLLTSPSHAQQHADINDAVEALETKVAIGNTVIGTYIAYTPTFSNFTVGNGTVATQYCRVNNFVHYFGTITMGSTSVAGGGMANSLPITADSAFAGDVALGTGFVFDASTGVKYTAIVRSLNSTTAYWNFMSNDFGYPRARNADTTNPITWATGDSWFFNITYKAA